MQPGGRNSALLNMCTSLRIAETLRLAEIRQNYEQYVLKYLVLQTNTKASRSLFCFHCRSSIFRSPVTLTEFVLQCDEICRLVRT